MIFSFNYFHVVCGRIFRYRDYLLLPLQKRGENGFFAAGRGGKSCDTVKVK
jgi:hypothetical protein